LKILELKITPREKPFPHLYFPQVFTEETYEYILANLPIISKCTTLDNYKEFRRVYTLADKPEFIEVNAALTDHKLRDTLAKLLNIDRMCFPQASIFRDLPGYSIAPHTDASFKIMSMILFLPGDDSQKMLGTRLLDKHIPTYVKQLGFFPNTGFAFKVTKFSWHDVQTTPEDSGLRDTLQTCYFDTPDRLFK
jgi:hypothetical protein